MNELRISNQSLPPYEFDYSFFEAREYIKKDSEPTQADFMKDDPIASYQFVFTNKGIHVGVAKRESGCFDIYYDGNWLDDAVKKEVVDAVPNEPQYHTCKEFMVTFDEILFEMTPSKPKENNLKVLKHGLSFDNAQRGVTALGKQYFTERIKNHCRLFSGLILIETNLFVAHGRNISQFYLKANKFVLRADRHTSFKYQIKYMFKRKILQANGEYLYNVGILLENGELHVLSNPNAQDAQNWSLDASYEKARYSIEGRGDTFSHRHDPQDFRCSYFLTMRGAPEKVTGEAGEKGD